MFTRDDAVKFIERLKSFYGAEFNRKWEGVKPEMMIETICASFRGVEQHHISKCFRRISTSCSDFCPSIPTLLSWCFDGELQSDYEAYQDACRIDHVTDANVYEAIRRIGFWNFEHKSENVMRPAFIEAYKAVKAEYMSGTRFEIPKKIEAPKEEVVEELTEEQAEKNKQMAAEYLKNLKDLMNKKDEVNASRAHG